MTGRTSGVEAFWWTIAEFCSRQLLPYVFADAEDERHQYTIVIHQVATRLRLDVVPYGEYGAVRLDDDVVATYEELVDVIVNRLTDETTRADWAGPVTGVGTINAFIRRLRSSLRPLRPIIRADLTGTSRRQISTQDQQVTVVDLHNLHERVSVSSSALCWRPRRHARKTPVRRAPVHDDRRAEEVRPPGRQSRRSKMCCWTSPSAGGRWA